MLRDRLLSAAVLISSLCVLLYLDATQSRPGMEGLWLLPALLFFAFGTAWDISGMLQKSGRPIRRSLAIGCAVVVTLSACVPMLWPLSRQTYPPNCPVGQLGWIVLSSIGAAFVILLGEMKSYGPETKQTIERTLAGVFVSLYVGMPMALLVALRSLDLGAPSGEIASPSKWGLAALLTMIATTKSADTGAYFVGRAIGRTKLVPRLSPGKTRAGAVGGIVTATIVAFACLRWLFPWIENGDLSIPSKAPVWGAFVLGPLLAIAGMIGDLAESLVKRDCQVKDSGNLLPGMGGVWDVTDSLIAAILPAFLCFVAGVAG